MDTVAARPRLGRPPALAGAMNRIYLKSFLMTLAGALPIALTAAPQPWAALAWGYTVLWILLMIPPAGAYFTLILDACLILGNRKPLMLPRLVVGHRARVARLEHRGGRRVLRVLNRYARIVTDAHPLANITIAFLLLAARFRMKELVELFDDAMRHVPPAPPPDAEAEIVAPLIERVGQIEPEFQMAC